MNNARYPGALLALVGLIAGPAWVGAQPPAYRIDATRSQADVKARCFGLFECGGRFSRFTGSVVLDRQQWDLRAVAVQIPVDSLESRPRFWRAALLGQAFFDATRYPSIEFSLTHAERTGRSTVEVVGNLTIRGTTRPLAFSTRVSQNTDAIDVSVETTVKRSAFGLGPALPLVSDEVSVVLRLRIVPAIALH